MFCMGEAPTLPGIKERFSAPAKLFSIQYKTNGCQPTPAPAFT